MSTRFVQNVSRYVWLLKSSDEVVNEDGVNDYCLMLDVMDVNTLWIWRYYMVFVPTFTKNNCWCISRLNMGTCSVGAPNFSALMMRLLRDVFENPDDCLRSETMLNVRVENEREHTFSFKCLNAILNLCHDYVAVYKQLMKNCKCNQLLDSGCVCNLKHMTAYRSFFSQKQHYASLPQEIFQYAKENEDNVNLQCDDLFILE